jgi:hypothetical protein
LYPQELHIAGINKPFLLVEHAHRKNGPNSAETMDLRVVQGVIDLVPEKQFPETLVDQSPYYPDKSSCPKLNVS